MLYAVFGVVLFLLVSAFIYKRNRPKFTTPSPESNEKVLLRFNNIRLKSQCTYAHKAKTYGAPDWINSLSVSENLARLLPSFSNFVVVAEKEGIDGFIIQVTDPSLYSTPDDVKALVLEVVRFFKDLELEKMDAKARASFLKYLESKGKNDKQWCDYGIYYEKKLFFLTPFAPCFPPSSSRYGFGEKDLFFLIQSTSSFALLQQLTGGDWNKTMTLRDKVRENFAKAGRPYAATQAQEGASYN